jgi:hypothetical protein
MFLLRFLGRLAGHAVYSGPKVNRTLQSETVFPSVGAGSRTVKLHEKGEVFQPLSIYRPAAS